MKFKLYSHKRNRFLKRPINTAGVIYGHYVAPQTLLPNVEQKHLNCAKLQAHITTLRKQQEFWQLVGYQGVYVLKELDLSVREWCCPSCQSVNGRDENTANNIQAGASTVGSSDVRQASPAIAV